MEQKNCYGHITFKNKLSDDADLVSRIGVSRDGADDAGSLRFFTAPAGSNISKRMYITSTDDISIGTATPNSKLEVSNGYIKLDISPGTTPLSDCDNADEVGRMKVDSTAASSNLYVCTPSGWITLTIRGDFKTQ